ncbi:MAG: hypothetical protein WC750_06175 [Patescibacteria group bacterium]
MGTLHFPYDVIGSTMKARATEILSDGKNHAYIETAHGKFLDMNICTTNSREQDRRYRNFVNVVEKYVRKKYKFEGKWGLATTEEVTREYIYKTMKGGLGG